MSISSYMIKIGEKAKVASHKLSNLDIERKNKVLKKYSNYLKIYSKVILKENKKDLFIARKVNNSLIERLRLNDDKINQIRNSIEKSHRNVERSITIASNVDRDRSGNFFI